jgi:hypothetical protein
MATVGGSEYGGDTGGTVIDPGDVSGDAISDGITSGCPLADIPVVPVVIDPVFLGSTRADHYCPTCGTIRAICFVEYWSTVNYWVCPSGHSFSETL